MRLNQCLVTSVHMDTKKAIQTRKANFLECGQVPSLGVRKFTFMLTFPI